MLQKIAAENLGGKLLRIFTAEAENLGGQNSCTWYYAIELWQALKSPRLVKCLRSKISAPIQNLSGKVWRPLTIWAQQNLQLLTSSKSG